MVKFNITCNYDTTDKYNVPTNTVGIDTDGYGRIWYNADVLLKM